MRTLPQSLEARERLVKKWHEDHQWRYKALAVLRYQHDNPDHTEEQAGALVGVDQPEAGRMLAAARLVGALVPYAVVRNRSYSKEDEEASDARYFRGEELRKLLSARFPGSLPRAVHIIPYDRDAFFNAAARLIIEIIDSTSAKTIGVNWGRMTSRAIHTTRNLVDQSTMEKFRARGIQCVPLSGDPVHHIHLRLQELTASTLAAEFQEILTGGHPPDMPCLTGVPAYIARRFRPQYATSKVELATQFTVDDAEGNPLLGFIRDVPGFRKIFGHDNHQGLIEQLDTVLTSVGVFPKQEGQGDVQTGGFLDERLRQEAGHGQPPHITRESLSEAVAGDIGGWLLPRRNANKNQIKMIADLNRGWIGLTAAGLKRVAFADKAKPGVILLGMSAEKASMVLEAVRNNLVSVLIVDTSLAAELTKLPELS
jgi:DNA-binding transcriptional regulator LsrR (DeoR family)